MDRTDYVCEKPVKSEQQIPPQVPTIDQHEHDQTDLHSVCPPGHFTHSFLSCDPQGSCWARFASSGVICESPLQPSPPNFVCSNEIEQVPYPLVCDHRPDCSDHSDENFCVFPPCSGPSYHCGKTQVIQFHHLGDDVVDDVGDENDDPAKMSFVIL